MKISFKSDYSEGCHPKIIEALTQTNAEQQQGYGLDTYSESAKRLILEQLQSTSAKVYLVSGGTQANLTIIASILRPHESVVSADTGHIFANETGAIEATGHKINTIPSTDGKITPAGVQAVLDSHTNTPHQLKQRLVYVSNATELGTVYSKRELEALSAYCKANELYLLLDGARLGQALTSQGNDLSLADIARLVDVFYIGGTKNGALIGEAIVITNPKLQEGFDYLIKQRGAMLAKGRLLGLQFQTLFTDDLFFALAKHANTQAMKIAEAFRRKGCEFLSESPTNQIFPILQGDHADKLAQGFDFYEWRQLECGRKAIRVITSWATSDQDVDSFVAAINNL